MSEEKKTENTTGTLEISNPDELNEKLTAAIENNENKPTEEEVEAKKLEVEESSKNFSVKSWDIGDGEKAQSYIDYIAHFMRNRIFWTKNGWMGVLKMNEELKDAEKFIKENPGQPLKLGYQAMEFLFYSFQNPGGIGLQAAQDFESENDTYAEVFNDLGEQLAAARKELKDIQFMQEQYVAMQQGFFLEVEEETEEAPVPEETPAQEEVADK